MSLSTTDFQFAIIPFGSARDAPCTHEFEWYLDETLSESGKIPPLNSAPVASWLLARLRALDDTIPSETAESNDGGGYSFEMAVAQGQTIVAAFQLQGDMAGVAVLGRGADAATVDQIQQQWVELLTQAPNEVAECCYTIVDPDWEMDPDGFIPTPDEGSQNEYGWKNGAYLGMHNIREE